MTNSKCRLRSSFDIPPLPQVSSLSNLGRSIGPMDTRPAALRANSRPLSDVGKACSRQLRVRGVTMTGIEGCARRIESLRLHEAMHGSQQGSVMHERNVLSMVDRNRLARRPSWHGLAVLSQNGCDNNCAERQSFMTPT